MESIAEEDEKKISESDSDVSVTVDEFGSAIQSITHAPHVQAQVQQVQIHVQKTPQRPQTAPQINRTPVVTYTVVDPIRLPITASRPVSVDDGKHKSFASKLSAFLQRKPRQHAGPSSPHVDVVEKAVVIHEDDTPVIDEFVTPLGGPSIDREQSVLMDHEMTFALNVPRGSGQIDNLIRTSKSSLADFMDITARVDGIEVEENKRSENLRELEMQL